MGIGVFRGSRDDVLDRYVQAALDAGADPIVRITSDCPLIEPAIIDEVLESYERTGAEFIYTEGFPRGTGDAELVTLAALAASLAIDSAGRGLLPRARHYFSLAASGAIPASRGESPRRR